MRGWLRFPEPPCIGHGADYFSTDELRVARAKAICRECPYQLPCLDHALDNAEPEGIWGGLDPHERHRVGRAAAAAERAAAAGSGGRRVAQTAPSSAVAT